MNNTTTGGMGDDIGAPHRIELIDQCADMEFGGVDGYAKPTRNRLV
jgi:hypothetical protein